MTSIYKEAFLDSPIGWQIGFQNPATAIMENIILLHSYIIMYLILVGTVVCWFLLRSIFLFRLGKNKSAMEFSHDPVIETVWTVAPVFILVSVIIPSFSLLYSMDEIIEPEISVKIIGHQWYWSYELDWQHTDYLGIVDKSDSLYIPPKKFAISYGHVYSVDWIKFKDWYNKDQPVLTLTAEKNFYPKKVEMWAPVKAHTVQALTKTFKDVCGPILSYCGVGWLVDVICAKVFPAGSEYYSANPRVSFKFLLGKPSFWWMVDSDSKFYFFHKGFSGWRDLFYVLSINFHYSKDFMPISRYDAKTPVFYNHTVFFTKSTHPKWKFMFEFADAKYLVPQYHFRQSALFMAPTVKFDSFLVPEAELQKGTVRLLEVDHKLVLPINTNIRLLVTSADVIHSWAVPSLGVKVDAIPGRLNQTSVTLLRVGKFYGQCSELCGANHGNMPIVVESVEAETFKLWIKTESSRITLAEIVDSKSFEIKIAS